ncbi:MULTISPECIES: N-acetylmuramic acid 6-phosphate etherase [Proteiniclasticum]|uniref:N-acetylmuramic acid 6-phosphate etherase n=1 Tax=Proteiniclasticum ruminis TaxID=398199 RepID=A0A1G8K652_9CLOT|nr:MULTISPECIES: N-acetylmuramic acid 6-phosphate etherase [Proteiniclasticum]SDI38873.1 N-acetylmuramic acid 6-phosphate etherase [Proteiniclasticum ruminis]
MIDLTKLTTEQRNPETMNLDQMTPLELVETMNREDQKVIEAVNKVLPEVAKVIEWTTEALRTGGRIIYMGAGTSGRLGVLDAVECPPTFGVSPDLVVGLMAGGEKAFVKAVEGAEDSETLGTEDLKNIGLHEKDVVIGIAASGRTPYVIHALRYARSLGVKTAIIACNKNSEMSKEADIAIEPVPGPEVLTGSTRLKAGTAQKLVLNMISTASMVGTGKAYENLMVDVMQSNEKLKTRAENIVMEATGCERETARTAIDEAKGSVKLAITSILLDTPVDEAEKALEKAKGHIRKAINK